jgi:TRAP-type C4-dicarboxylate transport system permease small subunit
MTDETPGLKMRLALWVGVMSTWIAMACLAAICVLFAASIVLRQIGVAIPAMDDISSILLAALFSFGMSAALMKSEHIAVTILVDLLRPRARVVADMLLRYATAIIVLTLAWGLSSKFLSAIASGQKMLGAMPIPRWLPIGVVLFGCILFAICLLLGLVPTREATLDEEADDAP